MCVLSCFLSLVTFIANSQERSEKEVTIYVSEFEGWAKDRKGVALDILNSWKEAKSIPIDIVVIPLKRAVYEYIKLSNTHKNNCFVGDERQNFEAVGASKNRIYSHPIAITKIIPFTFDKKLKINALKSFADKNLGMVNGLNDRNMINIDSNHIVKVTSLAQLFGLLKLGRIDVAISFFPDDKKVLQGFIPHFNNELYSYYDTFSCENNINNKRLVASFNSYLIRLINSGVYEEILNRYWQVTPEYIELMRTISTLNEEPQS